MSAAVSCSTLDNQFSKCRLEFRLIKIEVGGQ